MTTHKLEGHGRGRSTRRRFSLPHCIQLQNIHHSGTHLVTANYRVHMYRSNCNMQSRAIAKSLVQWIPVIMSGSVTDLLSQMGPTHPLNKHGVSPICQGSLFGCIIFPDPNI